jgi:ribose transport system substrate-binding protein
MNRLKRCAHSFVTISVLSVASTVAWSAEYASVKEQGDISPMCGTKPMVVGLADGIGGNTWRKTAVAEVRDELSHCKNVTRFIYMNANGDQQKAISDINSMVAQGVNVLVLYPDFGAAEIPAMRSATRAGVTVVPYQAEIPGTPGKDYAANVAMDFRRLGGEWADWLGANLKKGNVIFFGGLPGAPAAKAAFEGFQSELLKYPELKLLQNNFVVTNWNPIDSAKAVSGVIAKYPQVDGIAADYGVAALATIKAFQGAHLAIPAIATGSSDNELTCKVVAMTNSGHGFPYYSLDGQTSVVRFAVRRGVAMYQGTVDKEPLRVLPYTYADTAHGIVPKCDPDAPPDADFSSALAPQKLKAIFNQ